MQRGYIKIVSGLMRLLRPLTKVMLLCITLGTVGALCATAITVLGANLVLTSLALSPWQLSIAMGAILMAAAALFRAGLRYGEQICGHYIAFKLLATIRDQIFTALRRLAPAKLETRGRGDLIAVLTSDIELLEVFYAHTIAPVSIALVFSALMTAAIGAFHPLLGLLAAAAYGVVGIIIPVVISKNGKKQGRDFRNRFGELNSYFLESLRGLRENIQFGCDEQREEAILQRTQELNALQKKLKRHEGAAASWSGAVVSALTVGMLAAAAGLGLPFETVLMSTVMLSASFGPVLALSNLSSTLTQTLASGERVLNLLEEAPQTVEIAQGKTPQFSGAEVEKLSFSYGSEEIIHSLSAKFPQGKTIAIIGKSGSGKSTLLKLLMRFWEPSAGLVQIADTDINKIKTAHLRQLEGFMTQDTDLFHVSIADNIKIGCLSASRADVIAAAKKASIHDFILTLPDGYDTMVGELGSTLSGGERQRIGLARAFLHNAPFLLLDEPTSNLDSLNEGVILKAILEEKQNRTVLLVSHRKSTLHIADMVYVVENGRLC